MYYAVGSKPMDAVAKTRQVYLPKGTWIDFWTGRSIKGGKTIEVNAPLSRIPIHVRAGSIIPMGSAVTRASEQTDSAIELRVYPGANGEYTFYEDAGDGWGYERGEFALTKMRWNDGAKQLEIDPREGTFLGMNLIRQFKIVIVGPGNGNGTDIGRRIFDVTYEGTAVTVHTSQPKP
jgi:alpha-D-xyloside xylohydrolase